jgi:hypothetical protein
MGGRQELSNAPHPYREERLVEQPAIQLVAALGWQTASALDENKPHLAPTKKATWFCIRRLPEPRLMPWTRCPAPADGRRRRD